MEKTINRLSYKNDDFLNVISDSFIIDGHLYNASYIPAENVTVMLEEVIKYKDESIYYKNKINMVLINIIDNNNIKISSHSNITTADTTLIKACKASTFNLGLTNEAVEIKIA